MRRSDDDDGDGDEIPRPSREDIETLCILHAVGEGCEAVELAERLGLSSDLAAAVATCIAPLIVRHLVTSRDGIVAVTDEGNAWMKARLAQAQITR